MERKDEILQGLSEPQREAVVYTDGPALVIAGAGSGKTRVLTYKIAYLIETGIKPYQIMAITFTKKAATEMKERISKVVGESRAKSIWMGTFHSIFSRILRTEAEKIGYNRDFVIYDEVDSMSAIRSIVKEMRLNPKTYAEKDVMERISKLKNDLIGADEYQDIEYYRQMDMESQWYDFGGIYKAYQARLFRSNAMDFDDILFNMYKLLRDDYQSAFKYQNKFRYVLVDEYQDTNTAQNRIVAMLCRQHKKLCVVGDDMQGIYSFRGAKIRNILEFEKMFEGTKVFKLEENYRSTKNIVCAANSLISHNENQLEKHPFSNNEEGEKVRIFSAPDNYEEARMIAQNIETIVSTGGAEYDQIAVLYRANRLSRVLEEVLIRAGVPCKVYGGTSFYDREEVKDTIAYCRFAVNHADEEAFKRCVNKPTRGIGDTTVEKIIAATRNNDVTLWQAITNPIGAGTGLDAAKAQKVMVFAEIMKGITEAAETMDALHTVQTAIKLSGIKTQYEGSNDKKDRDKVENLGELERAAEDFCDRVVEEDDEPDTSVRHFMEDAALLSAVDKEGGEERKRVTLMSVHASKGLEFRIVHIAGVEHTIFPSPMSMGGDGIEEERRLMYVAMTRAEKRLYISYCKQRREYGTDKIMHPSQFLKEIDTKYAIVPRELTVRLGRQDASEKESREMEASRWSTGNFRFNRTAAISRINSSAGAARQGQGAQPNVGSARPHGMSVTSLDRAKASLSPEMVAQYKAGSFVKHAKFGIGEILRIEGTGISTKAIIKFNNFGERKIFLAYSGKEMEKIQ